MALLFEHDPEKGLGKSQSDDLLSLRAARDAAVQAAREAVRDSTRLTRLLSILNDSGPVERLLDRVLSTLSELFLADIVVLLDPVGTGKFSPLAAIGLSEELLALPFSEKDNSLTKRLMDTAYPLQIENADADTEIDFQLREMGAKTVVGFPVDGSDLVRGALMLCRCNANTFSSEEVGLLRTMAYRIGRTLIEAQRSTQFESLVKSGRELSRRLEIPDVAVDAVKMFSNILQADAAVVLLRNSTGQFYCASQTGLSATIADAICPLAEKLIIATGLGNGDPFSTADLSTTLTKLSSMSLGVSSLRAFLAIPIYRDDKLHGALFGIRVRPVPFNAGAMQTAMLFADQVTAAIDNATLYQAVRTELAERKRLEEEQRKWERQQQQIQKAKSLSSMAGAVAHHFNNQLCVVIGNLEVAMYDLPRFSEAAMSLKDAKEAAQKASEVSKSMLTYIGQTIGVKTPLDLSQICRQSLPFLQTATPEGLVLNVDLPPTGPIVRANGNQIQQILTHLLTNAWEAVDRNQGAVDIAVKVMSPDNIAAVNRFPVDWVPEDVPYACIEVSDTGEGIAETDIDKLFDPFFSRRFVGRGLGLPVVLGIVKAHNGAITLESVKGTGSVFRVFLPVSTDEIIKSTGVIAKSTAIEGRGVLLVDDEKGIRDVTTVTLTRMGLKVFSASDGVEAVTVFQEHSNEIHLILSDLSMPRMNGWETISALRRICPDIPVVLISGHDESKMITGHHTDTPAPVLLRKPFENTELKEAILKAMAGK